MSQKMSKAPTADPKEAKSYSLKLGKSFDKKPEVSYHTMRFDFKPVSLGSSKDLTMQIGGENGLQVTATMTANTKPGLNGPSQNGQTVYKGSKKPYSTKECVLIVDEVTGEVTLEKLGDNVMLKKARPEGGNKANPANKAKSDASPFGTPNYSPAPSSSPTPSPSQPVASQVTPKKPLEKPSMDKKIAPVQKPAPVSKPATAPPVPPQNPIPAKGRKDEEDQDVEMRSPSPSSSSSGSSSSSPSDSDSDSDVEDMDDLLKMETATVQKATGSSVNGTNKPSPNNKIAPSSAVSTLPSRTVASLEEDLKVSSDDSDDDGIRF